jgi:aryl-alcohol dehydrogenase-like predicted oxidoreductase
MRYLDIKPAKRISRIGLGTWQFGSREWGYGEPYAERESRAIVRRALELGVTLFDTAEIYGFGRSERILGRALGEDAESAFVATKIFPILPVAQLESNVAAAEIDLAEDEYQALRAASDRFRPVTGPAALSRLVRARLSQRGPGRPARMGG